MNGNVVFRDMIYIQHGRISYKLDFIHTVSIDNEESYEATCVVVPGGVFCEFSGEF